MRGGLLYHCRSRASRRLRPQDAWGLPVDPGWPGGQHRAEAALLQKTIRSMTRAIESPQVLECRVPSRHNAIAGERDQLGLMPLILAAMSAAYRSVMPAMKSMTRM